jgi:molybdopterin converting factor small subunit
LARVVIAAPLRGELAAPGEFEVEAADLFELEAREPGIADYIEARVSIAVDGELVADWSTPLGAASEVMLVPHIAGG